MTDLRDQQPAAAPATDGAADPLGGLYRMSKTAGLASSDYKAVNAPAVVSLILGAMSFLASFEPILLILPIVAIVLGIVAIRQIAGSNGTQTGLPLAVLGIVLALAMGAWAATGKLREAARTQADREQLVSIVSRLGEHVSGGQYQQAYNEIFSPTFRERVGPEEFVNNWRMWQSHPSLGKLKATRSNGLFNFEVDPTALIRIAQGQMILEYESRTPGDRPEIIFTYRDGQWWVEQIPALFPPPRSATPGGPGAPPGGM